MKRVGMHRFVVARLQNNTKRVLLPAKHYIVEARSQADHTMNNYGTIVLAGAWEQWMEERWNS